MQSPILNLSLIQRNPGNRRLDVKSSLQVIARELLTLAEEERRIRTNRRYKAAVLRVFKKYAAQTIPISALSVTCLVELSRMKVTDVSRLHSELEQHIRFNNGGYLRILPGKAGGVELAK